jgi:hypothetical protein
VRLGHGWSAQVSHGFVADAEELVPGDLRRTTASLHYGAEGDRPLAVSLAWGRNEEDHGTSDAFLAEGAWQATRHDHVFARAERVEKDRELLAEKHLHAETAEAEDPSPSVRSLSATCAACGWWKPDLGWAPTSPSTTCPRACTRPTARTSTHVSRAALGTSPRGAHAETP